MQLVHAANSLAQLPGTAVTIGNFDGIHKGHQALLRHTLHVCRQEGLSSVVITFWPHPRLVVSPQKSHCPLTSREHRLELLSSLGVEYVLEVPFTKEVAAFSPEEFVQTHLLPINPRRLIIGYDFTLGRGRSGDVRVLQALGEKWNFRVEQLPPLLTDGAIVSSTRLRELIGRGEVRQAARLIGRYYGFSGKVVHGDGRGSELGFPTANLLPPETLLPGVGVYATRVRVDAAWHKAVTNVGCKPTFDGKSLTVESFLLDGAPDLYGQHIRLEFVSRLRQEKRFESIADLKRQIGNDVRDARRILSEETF